MKKIASYSFVCYTLSLCGCSILPFHHWMFLQNERGADAQQSRIATSGDFQSPTATSGNGMQGSRKDTKTLLVRRNVTGL